MLSFPMTDYHSLCTNTNSKSKLCDVGLGTPASQHLTSEIYGKPLMSTSNLPYSSPKRSILCENGTELQSMQRPATRVTLNSHHIYAEPNASVLQSYAQPRCLITNIAPPSENCLLDTSEVKGLPQNDTFRALLTSNAHI